MKRETNSKKKKKEAPKLPRFQVPKSMSSRVFKTKKDKAMSRQSLKKLVSNADET